MGFIDLLEFYYLEVVVLVECLMVMWRFDYGVIWEIIFWEVEVLGF